MGRRKHFDVVIVGGGPAGLGCGKVLKDLGIKHFTILERDEVGSAFLRWPKEMRFISPSFTSNGFGLLDLNAIALKTSPAYSLETEHPSGMDYARYLKGVSKVFKLPVREGVTVKAVLPQSGGGFVLDTAEGALQTKFVVWAAGEFHYPRLNPFPGAELCVHNAQIDTWRKFKGTNFIVIGGFESGIDAAYNLLGVNRKATVRVIDRAARWESLSNDPSRALTPYTIERLNEALASERLELVGETTVTRVERLVDGYAVYTDDGNCWQTPHPPILAVGFVGSLSVIRSLLAWGERGNALLTEADESTLTPGLFVSGPMVQHRGMVFCYIYKFRQRFAVIAKAIGTQLGVDLAPLEAYRAGGMMLEDLSCCDESCEC